jgi:hypothetical protein
MDVPITQFRREIFSLVNQALEGRELWVSHKGRRLRLVVEDAPASRLSRITPLELEAGPNPSHDPNDAALKAELAAPMVKAWAEDWEKL